MAKLFDVNNDGANYQAQAVLVFLRVRSGLEASYISGTLTYAVQPEVDRWHNCREQGYVVTMPNKDYSKQINIAFFEHRNTDSICAVKWESHCTLNPPGINDIPKSHPYYESKYNYDFGVTYGKIDEMADWIYAQLNDWWIAQASR